MWKVVGVSEIGTSHLKSGKLCEDTCTALVKYSISGNPFLILLVADGAGSAKCGGQGADTAIEAALEFFDQKLLNSDFVFSDDLAAECISQIRDRISLDTIVSGLNIRDYSTTFLCLISSGIETLVIQIGDGGIVVDVGNGLELCFPPMKGEYENMTSFVTDENAIRKMQVKIFSGNLLRASAFSDGLERLTLNISERKPYIPVFEHFFKILASSSLDQEDELTSALQTFLSSPAVNERTDDDKTLTLAVTFNNEQKFQT